MTPVLEVVDLGVPFGGIRTVDGVSFAAKQNAITTIIGPNGAGKSTLFNLISGLIRPNAGRVVLRGVDRTGSPPHLMQRAGLGRSFQITNLFFELTVFENLRLAAQRLEPTCRFLLPAAKSGRALARVSD
jgi:branched-chain amino acid transport system ATP-binding protein